MPSKRIQAPGMEPHWLKNGGPGREKGCAQGQSPSSLEAGVESKVELAPLALPFLKPILSSPEEPGWSGVLFASSSFLPTGRLPRVVPRQRQGGQGGALPHCWVAFRQAGLFLQEGAGRRDGIALPLLHCQKLWGYRGVSDIVGTFKCLLNL